MKQDSTSSKKMESLNKYSDEVDEIRFWTKKQIENHLGENIFTPNFEMEFQLLKDLKLI